MGKKTDEILGKILGSKEDPDKSKESKEETTSKPVDARSTQSGLFHEEIPQMPKGYYSGDKPNSNLRAFVEAHLKEKPYDPTTDDYDVPAFDKPIETTKATAIYNMHTYWSKKPHDAIRQYIRHYTKPGDLVLDPFCGSGGTALAALIESRKAIAIDRSPAATFITKNYCTPVDIHLLRQAFDALKEEVKGEIDWLYETRCDRCGGKAITGYTVYSQVFQCNRCMSKIPLFDCPEVKVNETGDETKIVPVCPNCYSKGVMEEIKISNSKYGHIPVKITYKCLSGCRPQRDERLHNDPDPKKRRFFQEYDLSKIREIENSSPGKWFPTNRMMNAPAHQEKWGLLWRPYLKGIDRVDQFYTKRSLFALAIYLQATEGMNYGQDQLKLAVAGILRTSSKMYLEREAGRGAASGVYYIPSIFREMVVRNGYEYKVSQQIIPALIEISSDIKATELIISTQSALDLTLIPSNSVDYIFTDPPYSWKTQYGECNFLMEAWLNLDTTWLDDEVIINEIRGKTEAEWASMLKQAMTECFRVLKPGRWISLCYHDTSEGTWGIVQDLMAEVGFIVENATDGAIYIDMRQKSWKQNAADKVSKRDLVVNFRKPKPGETIPELFITGTEDPRTFNEKVHAVIREYLEKYPGATKDRIYDEVVSHMVRAGKMEAHDFEGLLKQVAEEVKEPVKKTLYENEDPNIFGTHEISRWYLKDAEFVETDSAESAKEDDAADKVERFIEKKLTEHPELEGIHYSDIFEQYIYTVKDKPRRHLAEWLLDYFYKTDAGTYRLPQSEEEKKLKSEGRAKGTHRRIKRFIAYLQQGLAIPQKEQPNDATLLEWLRYCKRSGLYEQGKLLYEKGGLNLDNLSEKDMVNAEEDYQVCVRLLARGTAGSGTESTPKRGRKKK